MSFVLLVLFYLILICIVIAVGDEIVSDISQLVNKIPQIYKAEIEPVLSITVDKIQTVITDTFGSFQVNLSDLPNRIASIVASASGSILKVTSGVATKVPSFLLNMLLIVISSFFFTLDYHRITASILRQFSPKTQEVTVAVKSNIVSTVGNFLKAYGIIILCTTVELFIGLSLLRVEGAAIIAVLIAIIDILPVFETEAILISIYVGLKLFGAIGIFLLPVLLTVVKNLNDNGIIRVFK